MPQSGNFVKHCITLQDEYCGWPLEELSVSVGHLSLSAHLQGIPFYPLAISSAGSTKRGL